MALVLKIIEHILYGYTNVLSKYSNIWNNLWLKCQNMKYKYQWISKYISTHKQINTNANSKSAAMHINIYLRSKYNATYNDWFLDIKMSGSILCTLVKWSSDLWIKEIDGKKYFRQEMNLRRSESIKKLQYSLNQPAIWWFEKRMSKSKFPVNNPFQAYLLLTKRSPLFSSSFRFWQQHKKMVNMKYLGQTIIQTYYWNYLVVLYKFLLNPPLWNIKK